MIQISNRPAGGTLVDIQTFILNGGLKIWKRGYPEIIGKHGKVSKSKKFTEQAKTKKAVSQMIVRYFFAELVKKEAITEDALPPRFAKWLDTSSTDCIFNDYQRKAFSRPHLRRRPWYLELRSCKHCFDSERDWNSKCDRETEEMEARGLQTQNPTAEEGMTEKEKRKATNKHARVEVRKTKRFEKARQKELAKRVLGFGVAAAFSPARPKPAL
jgi:hypothetical protein